jgi:hypothetical protein
VSLAVESGLSGYLKGVYPRGAERSNQDVFRRANERLLAAVGERVDNARPIPFLCECLDPECRSTVELSIEEFRELRESDNRYAIVTGHPRLEGERILEVVDDVMIVEKPGRPFVRPVPG